jgi:hypothetical protein
VSGIVQHFLPGDGYCTNPFAGGNLWVDYAFWPIGPAPSTKIHPRYVTALRDYAAGMCLRRSADKSEQAQSDAKTRPNNQPGRDEPPRAIYKVQLNTQHA